MASKMISIIKRLVLSVVAIVALMPSEAWAWCENLVIRHNIAEYACNDSAVNLYWKEDGGSEEQKPPGANCTVEVCCGTFCGSKGGRCRAREIVTSQTDGKRYQVSGVTGGGDWSGIYYYGIGGNEVQTTHVEHDDPSTVDWSYTTQFRVKQIYQSPAGFSLSSPGDLWYNAGTGNITVTAPSLFVNGTNLICVGWTSGNGEFAASGSGTSATISALNSPSTITWIYQVAFSVNLGVSGATSAEADLQPHSGSKLTRADQAFTTSVKEIVPVGDDRLRTTGWTGGTGDFPSSGLGTQTGPAGATRRELTIPVSGGLSLKQASGLTWNYVAERRLDVIIDPSLPGNIRDLIANNTPPPSPPAATNWTSVGQVIPAFAPQRVVDGSAGAAYVCVGYSGTGNVLPTTGAVNTVNFTNTSYSSITWKYKRAYAINVGFILDNGDPAPSFVNTSTGHYPQVGANDVVVGNTYTYNAQPTVNSPQDGVRYVCVGWQGSGDVPATGGTNVMSGIPVTQNSAITWIYRRENRLRVSVTPTNLNTAASPSPAVGDTWLPHNTSVTITTLLKATLGTNQTTCLGSSMSLGGVSALNSIDTIVGSGPSARFSRSFILDDPATVSWLYTVTEHWTVGQPITPPPGADPNQQPGGTLLLAASPGDTFDNVLEWLGPSTNRQLYPVRPIPSARLTWFNANPTGQPVIVGGTAEFPDSSSIQRHVAKVPVNLYSPPTPYNFVSVRYTTGNGASTNQIFNATAGVSVLLFTKGPTPDPLNNPVYFEIVQTIDAENSPQNVTFVNWDIGTTITNEFHQTRFHTSGYVFYSNAFYDATAYNRSTRVGPIIPVNRDTQADNDDMLVVWYEPGNVVTNIDWPVYPYKYICDWPADGSVDKIYIASQIGSGPLPPTVYPSPSIYYQNNPALPGYNPNEEHAALYDVGGSPAAFALRNDLNAFENASLPYVLLRFMDPILGEPAMKVFKVEREGNGYSFIYPKQAGQPILPPYPLSILPQPSNSYMSAGLEWYHRDHKNGHWAKAANTGTNVPDIEMRWFYPLQLGWYFPDFNHDGSPDATEGSPVPLLNGGLDLTNLPPVAVHYPITWPTNYAVLTPGETLTKSKNGLPDVFAMAAAKVIFDQNVKRGGGPLVKLLDPVSERFVPLANVPASVRTEQKGARRSFPDLPAYLKRRLTYDNINKRLYWGGVFDQSGVGDPLLLLNVMSLGERQYLQNFAPDWATQIGQLYDQCRNPNGIVYAAGSVTNPMDNAVTLPSSQWATKWGIPLGLTVDSRGNPLEQKIIGLPKALTAGATASTGWVTVVENDDDSLGAAPVALHVFRVEGEPYRGEIKVINSDNLFDEKLTLRHSGDFGGEPDKFVFAWYYQPDTSGFAPQLPPNVAPGVSLPGWTFFASGPGLQEITIEGASPLTLADNWFAVRYNYTNVFPFITNNYYVSRWAGAPGGEKAQLAEGWIKRVIAALNPFDARVTDFHATAINTIVSMLAQAGHRFEGPIAFSGDPCNLNSIGLIEAYQTILNRGRLLSVDAGINYGPANVALLNASTRLSDLYMLLGNEAYQDAVDPTIGFGTSSGEYGTLAPSIFAFQNQVPSLLDEELVLLRGRDDSAGPTRAAPVYNRFFWNFTQGEGEIAYKLAYNITDQQTVDSDNDGCPDQADGVVNENDAKVLYPQGHGDAWGHYLSATKFYYNLLAHPNFTWEPRVESVLVGGAAIAIDYLDERKFAQAAAAKAKAGSDIVDLTYRKAYVDDPAGQWQGYKDTDRDRAWGMDDWARRAGQGAYFDWAVANAIIPSVDPNTNHTGIAKIDRTTVMDIRQVAQEFSKIQSQMDKADKGLNPLGLAKGVVPFDIDPSLLDPAISEVQTHFEQVYTRALNALQNAVSCFDYANQLSVMLRQNQDSLDDFSSGLEDQERDYNNRLIEIFGYPYADDIGPNGAYPTGYDGPDWLHFMYVDPSELNGDLDIPPITSYSIDYNFTNFTSETVDTTLGLTSGTRTVEFTFTSDGKWIVKPPEWTSKRRAPGEIQTAISDLILSKANLEKGMDEYNLILRDVEAERTLLEAQFNQNMAEIQILSAAKTNILALDDSIKFHNRNQLALSRTAESSDRVFEAIIEGIPKVAGIAANDVCAPARAALYGSAAAVSITLNSAADGESSAQLSDELSKEQIERNTELQLLSIVGNRVDLLERYNGLLDLVDDANVKRLELATIKEQVEQAVAQLQSVIAQGERLLDERTAWRTKSAPEIQELRYQDMAFRIVRNDALQKYRAQFDLAARYAYLAATAYDYETCLLGGDNGAGREFLTDIVRQRSLGQLLDGKPVAGRPGLADPLARLSQNFAVYKSQMGFNNPQTETSRFSLRKELFRIRTNETSDVQWQNILEKYRVADLNAVPNFRRYCRPFAPDDAGPQPGLVIPFNTMVQYGKNFFGWPLSGGDSTYDPTHFATKIRSVGCWFNNYNGQGLSFTPRVYLIPVGADIMRSPSGDTLSTREWQVVDQKIPVPFPIGNAELTNPNWIPINDSLSDTFSDIRRFSRFRAYHDSGDFDPSEASTDSRLIGRSVWNTQWMLIIPGETLLNPSNEGLDTFIYGQPVPGGGGARDGDGVKDILLFFQTYAYSGN